MTADARLGLADLAVLIVVLNDVSRCGAVQLAVGSDLTGEGQVVLDVTAGADLGGGRLRNAEDSLGKVAAGLLAPLAVAPLAEDVVSCLDTPRLEVVVARDRVHHLVVEPLADRCLATRSRLDLLRCHRIDLDVQVDLHAR